MVAEARLKSKNLYKVEPYLLKIMPMVIALAYLVNTVSSYFGVDIPILASIAGMSLIPLIFMYISSYVFKLPQDEMDTEANAITISAYGASLVAVNSRRGSSIVHEAEHIKNHIWQYIGYTPQRDNDEVDAYLLTYIYDKITQVFYKHKDNKE